MRLLGPASEADMVLAFLRAESDGPRWQNAFDKMNRQLVRQPNLADAGENQIRLQWLDYRGFRLRTMLFQRFPLDAQWQRWAFTIGDIAALRYADYPTWVQLSGGTRLLRDGARNVDQVLISEGPQSINAGIRAVAAAVDSGQAFDDLICAAIDEAAHGLVVIEGHTRATAYLVAQQPPTEVTAIVGWSPHVSSWLFY